MHLHRGTRPVDTGFALRQLCGVSDPLRRLRFKRELTALDALQEAAHERRPHKGKVVVDLASGSILTNKELFMKTEGAGVEAFLHAHDCDAGLAISGHDGSLDGGSATPSRQKRRVEIETAKRRRR